MERLYKIKTALMLILCAVALSACSSDEPEYKAGHPDYWAFTINLMATGIDQQALVSTIVGYTDPDGQTVSQDMHGETLEIKSKVFKDIPGSTDIIIIQNLRSDVDLTKASYNLGLGCSIVATSVNDEQYVISSKGKSERDDIEIAPEDISQYLPRMTKYTITVTADGTVDITKK